MAADEEGVVQNKASIEDEYLRCPHSGAYFRNPFKEERQGPICLSVSEFEHNCLEEALSDWHCVNISEATLRGLTKMCEHRGEDLPATSSSTALSSSMPRVALGKLAEPLEFTVTVRKTEYTPSRAERRHPAKARKEVHLSGALIEKLNIEVCDADGASLRVVGLAPGLIAEWNHKYPCFEVRPNDLILRVNSQKRSSQALLDELVTAPDTIKMIVRRVPAEPEASTTAIADVMTSASLVKPKDRKQQSD